LIENVGIRDGDLGADPSSRIAIDIAPRACASAFSVIVARGIAASK